MRANKRITMKPITIVLSIILALCFVAAETYAATQNDQRIISRIPRAAKERDTILIRKFMELIIKGDEPGARSLATDGSDDDSGAHKNYSSEKIARLPIFNNPKAKLDGIYYHQDIINEFKHLRYYFVIYETGQHRYPETMKIEMINYDDLFYLNRFWAPR